MTTPGHIREEVAANLEVLLLLMFMVAGIYFMKQLLLFIFTRLLLGIRSKMLLSLAFLHRVRFSSRLPRRADRCRGRDQRCRGFLRYLSQSRFGAADDDNMLDDSHD